MYQLIADCSPVPEYHFQKEYSDGPVTTCAPNGNFLKGVKWSPDGLCFLTASDDNWFRIYDTPQEAFAALAAGEQAAASPEGAAAATPPETLSEQQQEEQAALQACDSQPPPRQAPRLPGLGAAPGSSEGSRKTRGSGSFQDSFAPALRVEEGELVYDYAWFPRMSAADPASCCFASTSRAHPVHLWDACTGELRCTYRAYDAADEVTAAYSLAFDADGTRLYCGFNRCIRAFDVARPGRDYRTISTYQKKQEGQPGIVSCLAFDPDRSGMLAAGAYSGVAALYDTAARGALIALLEGHTGGVTQVQFSVCGNYLYSGARRDPAIHCWDVRYSAGVVYTLARATPTTNQRIAFDIEPSGRHLATGGEDGAVRLFDLRNGREVAAFPAADDTVNGCHFHPYLPLLATASGHRRFFLAPSDSSASSSDDDANAEIKISGATGTAEDTHTGPEEGALVGPANGGASVLPQSRPGGQGDAAAAAAVHTTAAAAGQRMPCGEDQQLGDMAEQDVGPGGHVWLPPPVENALRVWRLGAVPLEAQGAPGEQHEEEEEMEQQGQAQQEHVQQRQQQGDEEMEVAREEGRVVQGSVQYQCAPEQQPVEVGGDV